MSEKYPALLYSEKLWENCKNGVCTFECNAWEDFENRIEEFKKAKYKYM